MNSEKKPKRKAKRVKISSETPCDVFIGKGSRWAIPVRVRQDPRSLKGPMERNMLYANWIEKKMKNSPSFIGELKELRGKTLGCGCSSDVPCHGDILVEYINSL